MGRLSPLAHFVEFLYLSWASTVSRCLSLLPFLTFPCLLLPSSVFCCLPFSPITLPCLPLSPAAFPYLPLAPVALPCILLPPGVFPSPVSCCPPLPSPASCCLPLSPALRRLLSPPASPCLPCHGRSSPSAPPPPPARPLRASHPVGAVGRPAGLPSSGPSLITNLRLSASLFRSRSLSPGGPSWLFIH